ncbi:hypothetical protein XENOCAPTIV_013310 [Xenoophorus captivus]|uniref:Integrin alpha second immunoglobulin-like domain-containing protein n=1 Tax=Xenoophorus captivus TaxID=1517983 RepID=A0ABV0R0F1_9TELE
MPVLDAAQPSRAVAEVNFLKEGCKNKRICYSNLQMDHSLHYKQISQDAFSQLPTRLKCKLHIVKHFITIIAHNVPQFVLSYEKKDLALKVTVTNKNGDDAYEAKLVGKFPDALSYSGVRPITVSIM